MAACCAPLASAGVTEDSVACGVIVHSRHRLRSHSPAARRGYVILADGLFLDVGRGPKLGTVPHQPAVSLTFTRLGGHYTISVTDPRGDPSAPKGDLLIVATMALCEHAFDFTPQFGRWHMSAGLRVITASIAACARTDAARDLYLRAKGLELACETFEQLATSSLTPFGGSDKLSEADTRRLIAARAIIEERPQEPLTLNGIARACGLNRSSLARGFRVLFGTTVASLISEMRMQHAKNLLLTTDLRIAAIGFRSGYKNGASFARAFARYHGISPLALRAARVR